MGETIWPLAVKFAVVILARVESPVVERVLTVVDRALRDPVDDTDDPVTAPALTPAKVEVPATPKVDEAVKEVTVDAPLFKEAREDREVEDRVVPVILVEVRLAKVARPVEERVETVVPKALREPVDDREEPVIAPLLIPPKLVCPETDKEDKVEAPAFKEPVDDRDDPVVAPAKTPARVVCPATPKVEETVKVVIVLAPASNCPNLPNPPNERLVPVMLVVVMLAKVERPVPDKVVRVTLAS